MKMIFINMKFTDGFDAASSPGVLSLCHCNAAQSPPAPRS